MKSNKIQENILSDWKPTRLGDIVDVISGGTPDTADSDYWDGDINWITPSEITKTGKYIISETKKKISNLGLKNSSATMIPKNSLILCSRATIGECSINSYPITTNQGFKNLIPRKDILIEFLYYKIKISKKILLRMSSGSTFLEFSKKDIQKLKISLPEINEQNRIILVLKTWDKAIEKLTKKIELKRNVKKGLMQRLLTDKLRLPGFSKPWNVFRLGDISKMSSGGTPLSKVGRYYNGNILWVSIADMTKQGKYITDTEKKLTEEGLQDSAAKVYPVGTILYAMYASIGECGIATIEMTSSQAILGIEPNKSKLNNIYLYYFLIHLKDEIKLLGQQGTQSNLNAGIVKDFKINLPVIEEQENIVDILQSADNEIELLEKKLNKFKEQKNYLLNNLITGAIRTPETMKINS